MTEREKILLVGAGTMGCGLAVLLAKSGRKVVLHDTIEAARLSAKDRISATLNWLVDNRMMRRADVEPALALIELCSDLKAAAEATFIIEAIPEDVELKRQVFADLDRLSPPTCVLATNSSSFTLADVGTQVVHRERLLATHFYNPPYLVPLVEIAHSISTADWAVERAHELMIQVGKVPIHCRDSAGYIAVRLQVALVNEAVSLLEQGLASAEDIDKAVRYSFGVRLAVMGPLEMADRGGLDIWLNATDYLHRVYGQDKFRAPDLLRRKVACGELGVKTGHGLHGDTAPLVTAGRDRRLLGLLQHLGLVPLVTGPSE